MAYRLCPSYAASRRCGMYWSSTPATLDRPHAAGGNGSSRRTCTYLGRFQSATSTSAGAVPVLSATVTLSDGVSVSKLILMLGWSCSYSAISWRRSVLFVLSPPSQYVKDTGCEGSVHVAAPLACGALTPPYRQRLTTSAIPSTGKARC